MAAIATSSSRSSVRSARSTSPQQKPRLRECAAFDRLVFLPFMATIFGGLECLIILHRPDWHGALCALILAMVFSFNVCMFRLVRLMGRLEHDARLKLLQDAICRVSSGESR